jgi:hypothetical protein
VTVRQGESVRVEIAPIPDTDVVEIAYWPGGMSINGGTGWETRVWDAKGVEQQL